ncbi:uncharacterized protein LOC125593890 [Brassica napus]|uniref:uncharacterized protein LOC125593890 n=1 Tax=Brassica napus TaxID=3708 RepID=UPI00207897A1|nr:uncharacterized protein LOC125593890 [Brassica napus]
MNNNKTELFISGVDQSETAAITSYGFPYGTLPIRYLGFPLMSRKLKISEYAPLMVKLNMSFQSWSAKLLSFAGRLQLLKTVIFGTVTFWTSAYILPKVVYAKLSLSAPVSYGPMFKVYLAATVNTPSLWVDWHQSTHLTGQSFWTINAAPTDSWAWRKLLDLRPLALRFCKSQLGNGKNTSFWHDVWTPLGQLRSFIGDAGPRSLRVRTTAMVADTVTRSRWNLPHPRSQREVDLHAYLTTINLPLPVDVLNNVEVLRPRQASQSWVDVVWFKGAIPKHSFNMWVANYDRLPTRSRLAAWGLPITSSCPFCSNFDETRDHLLLSCEYSVTIWREIFIRCHPPASPFANWSELLSWIRVATSSKLKLLRKLASQTMVYHVWKQRNNLIHNQTSVPAATVFRGIDRELRNIISARRHRKRFDPLMVMWLR